MQQHGCSCDVLRTNSSSKKYVIGLKGVRVELEGMEVPEYHGISCQNNMKPPLNPITQYLYLR